jgi:hypothetical protein
MRLTKTITIDDDRITVWEVTVKDWLSIMEKPDGDIKAGIDSLLPKCTDLTVERMKQMTPSELKKVWDAFREVNAVFFSAVQESGLFQNVINATRRAVAEEMENGLLAGK